MPSGDVVGVTIAANPGRHNILNATASIAVADVLHLDVGNAAEALSCFKGARRRFTQVGSEAGITVVDDYGHHPTEIAATLEAASTLDFKRIVCVFQPHRYTRTQLLKSLFGKAFDHADKLYVMDVFPAGETPIPGISGKTIVSEVLQNGTLKDVTYIASRRELVNTLCDECREGDLVITQGAGDITLMGPAFIQALRERATEE